MNWVAIWNAFIDILIEILQLRTLVIILILLVCYAVYVAYPLLRAKQLGRELNKAVPYQLLDGARDKNILVLGDSTAVGVGASPEESVAGRLGAHFRASVENYARSGAVAADLRSQASYAKRDSYDLVVIQIGANDIIKFRSLTDAAGTLSSNLEDLKKVSGHIIVLTAGDIGSAPLFKWPLSSIMTKRTLQLRELFKKSVAEHGGVYVDIFAKSDPFKAAPDMYYAKDGLHLSAQGYKYWTELILESMDIWPELRMGRVL